MVTASAPAASASATAAATISGRPRARWRTGGGGRVQMGGVGTPQSLRRILAVYQINGRHGKMRLGAVRGVSYGLFGPPDEFGPQVQDVRAGVVRAYVYWSQIEPEPGRYAW